MAKIGRSTEGVTALPFYAVVGQDDDSDVVCIMEADGPTLVPTWVFGESWVSEYVGDLVQGSLKVGAVPSVQAIHSRLGAYNRLIEVGNGVGVGAGLSAQLDTVVRQEVQASAGHQVKDGTWVRLTRESRATPVANHVRRGVTDTVIELGPGSTGRWLVETQSGSTHLFDLDASTYTRRPGRGKDRGVGGGGVRSILEVEHWPRVNSVFRVWLEGLTPDDGEEGVVSAYVVRIVELEADEDVVLEPQTLTQAIGQAPPINAWLLIGDEASYPSSSELAAQRRQRDPDLLQWTSPRQAQRGDLMFLYFMAPTKAVHFAARAMYPPVYDPAARVNALKHVDPHQWWTDLTPMVGLPPIAYSTLKELHGGSLILRGKPTHYLSPVIVAALIEQMGDLDEEQRLVLQRPTGSPDLANPLTMTFEEWRALSDGPLQLEAQVEQYVIEPLLRLCLSGEQQTSWQKRLKIPGAGVADYGVFSGGKPSGVIEVKIGVRLPRDGDWRSSPDFQQIFRYAAASNLPAALIDSSRIFLFAKGERAPSMWIDRHTATDRDLETIRSYLA